MANTGSLESEAIRRYNRAYVRDLLEHYPQITGFRPDWPEYPCYKVDEAFQDFGPYVRGWAEAHGFDFAGAVDYCTVVFPKLYTMHWSVMVEFWGQVLLEQNPGLDETLVVRALAHLVDLGDEIGAERLSDYGYPEPHEAHPILDAPQFRKIEQVLAEAGEDLKVTPLMHGYGPADDFIRRSQVVADSPADGVWINRYGYLSDEKLSAIGRIWT